MAASSFFFILFLQFCSTINGAGWVNTTAVFIFGDSTVDTGNNNYVSTTLMKADFHPYGMDFPGKVPTGRFSDGKLVPDFLVSMLGLKETLPPYLQPNLSDAELRTGVCFASAGSGYDRLTTDIDGVIPMAKQLEYFKEYIERLKKIVGDEQARQIVSSALVVVSAGTNDFVFDFYDIPIRRLYMSISRYQDFVLQKLQNFVKELHSLGCRIIVVTGLPPVGCVPVQLTFKSPIRRRCSHKENSDSQSYNVKLAQLLPKVQATLPGSKILYADIFTPLMDMISNPGKYGFVETAKGCCGSGKLEGGPLCNPSTLVCQNPSQHVFFDSIHPTEATYKHLTDAMVKQLLPKLIGGH